MSNPALVVRDLTKSYDGRPVVDRLSMEAHAGQVTAVLGPNGAGKTTTIECCEGLRTPDSGEIRVLGMDPAAEASAARARVGVMLQDGGLPSGARALEVLTHVSTMYARPRSVDDLVDRLGLAGFAGTTVRRLSGGQRQRLALAIAVVGRPELVFLDEPSAGLDPQSRRAVWDLVRELRDTGVAIVLTTHLMDEAENLADRVYVVDHGSVVAEGTTEQLLAGREQTIRVETSTGLDVAIAASLLSQDTGSDWNAVEESPGVYLLHGEVTPAALRATTTWLVQADALAHRISTGRRTLEDVFLELTGRTLR
ncbi:ABC-2 type transport system ATP-binding protein [Paraoerskovia marina]|uniref:ABC-2 type transport system ATP-binding protein n=1 Tax=Paraoerskovia marina TaxID=545619 RepID=A0A1H1TGU3_9CELL|nr:ABC transporter ATP-binding protein [Paraoerskovia marina]SDS59430.1 ABC-2 type transport system ATP-binding protein [Paraoerskovia marina]